MAIAAFDVFNRGELKVKRGYGIEYVTMFAIITIEGSRIYLSREESIQLAADLLALTADVEEKI